MYESSSSATSSLNLGVKPLQFHAGVFDPELPVDAALFGIRFVRPNADLLLQFVHFTDAAVAQALARQATQFTFCDVQPTPVFRSVAKVDAFYVRSRAVWLERFIERSFGVGVQVVANESRLRAGGITRVQHLSHFARPVGLGPPFASGRLPKAR